MRMIGRQEVWEDFLAHRLRKGRFTWNTFEEADSFVETEKYLEVVSRIAAGDGIGIPVRSEINKMGSSKKRVVYHFPSDEMTVLKLISHLLYRYDGLFASGCYAFRRGKRVADAIFQLRKSLKDKRMWAYKVDIHDYFNSISIPVLLPILSGMLRDDPELYSFLEGLLDDDRSLSGDTVVRGKRGVMAGTPTAPFLANVYLNEVDHYFEDKGVLYARYSDDIILFAESREELDRIKEELLGFFAKYKLEVNHDKEHIYSPDEPFEFLGFSIDGNGIDIAKAAREKMKGKIRRKAHSLRRWASKSGKNPVYAMKGIINSFNRKFFESDDPDTLSWSRWYFPVVNRTEGFSEIDHYLQDSIRFLATGKHNGGNYRIRYANLKALGYRSLVHEYYLWSRSRGQND